MAFRPLFSASTSSVIPLLSSDVLFTLFKPLGLASSSSTCTHLHFLSSFSSLGCSHLAFALWHSVHKVNLPGLSLHSSPYFMQQLHTSSSSTFLFLLSCYCMMIFSTCLQLCSSIVQIGDRLTLFLTASSAFCASTLQFSSTLHSTSSCIFFSASSQTLLSTSSFHTFAWHWHSLHFIVLTPSLSFSFSTSWSSDQRVILPRGADMEMIVVGI